MAELVSVMVGKYDTDPILKPKPETQNAAVTEAMLESYVDQRVLKSGTATTLWSGTQTEYDALPTATRETSGFIAVIV